MTKVKMGVSALVVAVLVTAVIAVASAPDASGQGGGVSTPGLVDAGTLTLHTEKGQNPVNQFVYADADDVVVATQVLGENKCVIQTDDSLAALATSKGSPGIKDGAIGSKDKGPGRTCSRTEAPQTITVSLSGTLADFEMSSVSLDAEVKKNAHIQATASLDGNVTDVFELRSGGSVVGGEGSSALGSQIFNCSAQSDSGPDSGDSDNCLWERDVLADTIVFQSLVGEWSLEGGADGGATAESVITLTDIDALLDCESQPNGGTFDLSEGGDGDPFAGVVRKDNLDPNEPCQLIGVNLDTSSGEGGQEIGFFKDLTSQTSAAFVITAIWDVESAQNPPPPTTFDFELPGVPAFDLELCVGTPVYDGNGNFDGIAELLDADPGNDPAVDQAPGTPGIQYACYFHQETDLVGDGEIQLTQLIYLIGDWRSFR